MTCIVCGWQQVSRRGRCDACRAFARRHGRDKTIAEVEIGWNRAMDRVGRMVIPQVAKVTYNT